MHWSVRPVQSMIQHFLLKQMQILNRFYFEENMNFIILHKCYSIVALERISKLQTCKYKAW